MKRVLLCFLMLFATQTTVMCHQVKLMNKNCNVFYQRPDSSDYWVEAQHINLIFAHLQTLPIAPLVQLHQGIRLGQLSDEIITICAANEIPFEDARAIIICTITYNRRENSYNVVYPTKAGRFCGDECRADDPGCA